MSPQAPHPYVLSIDDAAHRDTYCGHLHTRRLEIGEPIDLDQGVSIVFELTHDPYADATQMPLRQEHGVYQCLPDLLDEPDVDGSTRYAQQLFTGRWGDPRARLKNILWLVQRRPPNANRHVALFYARRIVAALDHASDDYRWIRYGYVVVRATVLLNNKPLFTRSLAGLGAETWREQIFDTGWVDDLQEEALKCDN